MSSLKITVASKNNTTIKNFYSFLSKNILNNSYILEKIRHNRKKRKKLTILKSPHVNKIAQEHFKIELLKKQFKLQTTENSNFSIFLKKFNFNLYPDINLKLKYKVDNTKIKNLKSKILNPNNFKFNKYFK
jgi:ribosomal protein S10